MYISKKEYTYLLDCKKKVLSGKVLTADGLRFICESFKMDPYKIGVHFLTLLACLESSKK